MNTALDAQVLSGLRSVTVHGHKKAEASVKAPELSRRWCVLKVGGCLRGDPKYCPDALVKAQSGTPQSSTTASRRELSHLHLRVKGGARNICHDAEPIFGHPQAFPKGRRQH